MAAGVLSQAGYYMGDNLYRANARNPKGFFECSEVNGINEDILERVVPDRPRIIGNWLFRHRPERNQRWLASLAVGTRLVAPEKGSCGASPIVSRTRACPTHCRCGGRGSRIRPLFACFAIPLPRRVACCARASCSLTCGDLTLASGMPFDVGWRSILIFCKCTNTKVIGSSSTTISWSSIQGEKGSRHSAERRSITISRKRALGLHSIPVR